MANQDSAGARTENSERRSAYWIKRPGRVSGKWYYYRRHDGVLFDGLPPLSEIRTESTYTSPAFLGIAPLKVYFDFTNRCNLSCRHCITSSSPDVDTSEELSTERINELIAEIARIGVLEIATGGGEPLMHPEWASLLWAVTASGLNLIVTTNGLRLTDSAITTMKGIGPLEIRVSFDGGPYMHEHVRGRNTYKRAMRGLARLIEADMNCTARLTLCRGAEDELPILFDDLRSIGASTVKVAVVKRAGRAATKSGGHLVGSLPGKSEGDALIELGAKSGLTVQLSADDFPVPIVDARDPKLRDAERGNCGAGLETCYITPKGQILGCVVMPDLRFGQLQKQSFVEIWKAKEAADYRRRAASSGKRRLCDAMGPVGSIDGGMAPLGKKTIRLEVLQTSRSSVLRPDS
jgi:MoaA/NifB/PqqE/SkfB family radical SAM enzyme